MTLVENKKGKTCENPLQSTTPHPATPFLFLRMLLFALGKWAAVAQLCSHQYFTHIQTAVNTVGKSKQGNMLHHTTVFPMQFNLIDLQRLVLL